MKIFTLIFSLVVVVSVVADERPKSSLNAVLITPEFVNQLADEARTNNPALRGMDARAEAAVANEQSVRRWEDPVLKFGTMFGEREMREEEGDLVAGIEQKLPLFGKPKAEKRMAEAETKVEEANAEYESQQLRKDIALAVFRIGLADRTVEIAKEDLAWLDTMLESLEALYQAAGATQVQVLRVRNERSKQADRLKTESQRRAHEHVNLNRLINRNRQSPWPALQLPEVAGPIVFNDKLLKMAASYEPKLKRMEFEINQAKAVVDATRRKRYPDFAIGAEARRYSGSGDFREGMVTLSFNFPWGNGKRYAAELDREKARQTAIELETADYQLDVYTEIHDLTLKIDAARREALLYQDEIIPRSQLALENAQNSWRGNVGMFNDVLEARRMLLEGQLMFARAQTEQYQMMSELVLCCGLGDLEALKMLGAIPENENSENKEP